jgi:hypothetical protein
MYIIFGTINIIFLQYAKAIECQFNMYISYNKILVILLSPVINPYTEPVD